MNPVNNIHDKFVKEFLSDKEMATSFLEAFLPSELAEELNFETLAYVNTQYMTPQLEEYYADVVVNIRLKNQQECQICFLLEHKSYLDKNVVFQVLSYMAEAYLTQLKNKEKLKPIIPLIYYHGSKKWNFKQIDSYFDAYPAVLKKHLPLYESLFVSLKSMDEVRIQSLQNAMLRSALMLQHDADNPEKVVKNLVRIIESLEPYLDSNFLLTIFVYTLQTTEIKEQQLKIILEDFPNKLNNKVMSTYDMILEKGIEKGIEKSVLNAFDNNYKPAELAIIFGLSESKILELLKTNGRV